MKVLLIFAVCLVATACHGRATRTVSEVLKEANRGLRGEAEVAGTYDFHPEEDTLRDGDGGAILQLVLLPLLKDVPVGERYEARVKLREKFHGQRVVVSGELKKGRIEGWSREIIYVAVSKLEKEG